MQQWLLCLEPMRLVYQDQMIQLKRYDMVQYPQVQNSTAQSPELRLLEVITPEANRSNKGQLTIKQTKFFPSIDK